MWGPSAGCVLASVLVLASAGAVRAFPVVSGRAAACERVARRYETRCLMPRIEARFRFAEDGEVPTFVDRMRTIDHACTDVTATALAACPAWPRVRPSGEYRRWLRGVRETWERRQGEIDGQRPVCPAGGASCL